MLSLKNALSVGLLLVAKMVFAQIPETPFTEFTYNPANCQGIRHVSGSEIFIPEQAFVLKSTGKYCSKKITIKYREFHSQADMVAANIPMTFMQGKKKHQLESGGMFEILAFCNDEPMELAKGKKIQVRFACKNDLENLDAFYFEPEKGWQLLNTPVTDFSVRKDGRNLGELWGNIPPQPTIETTSTVRYSVEITEEIIVNQRSVGENVQNYETEQQSLFRKAPGMFRGMDISKMGLYNFDRVLNETGNIPITANFMLKSGEKVDTKVYVTYSGINTVVYYMPSDWQNFALLPRKDIQIFTILNDGKVAQVAPRVVKTTNFGLYKNKPFTFELEVVEGAPQTKEQLAQKTGINP